MDTGGGGHSEKKHMRGKRYAYDFFVSSMDDGQKELWGKCAE